MIFFRFSMCKTPILQGSLANYIASERAFQALQDKPLLDFRSRDGSPYHSAEYEVRISKISSFSRVIPEKLKIVVRPVSTVLGVIFDALQHENIFGAIPNTFKSSPLREKMCPTLTKNDC